ncbi:MAG TPA: hypothetical protein PK916_08485 [Bacteroidota bacterium]|nr:hypothetical protein [Bacteroidota bacterium]
MNRHSVITLLIYVAALAVILIVLFVPVPHAFSTYGAVVPVREWVLLRNDNGQVVSVLRDNRTGAAERYTVTQAERGDAMNLQLAQGSALQRIAEGDTVAWISSPELAQQDAALAGALAVAEAGLRAAKSGEKQSIVEQAQQQLAFAQAAFAEQEGLHARRAALHDKGTISDEEYDLSAERLRQLRIAVDIARAQLAVATTGMKDDYIREKEAEVLSLRTQREALQQRLRQYTLIAPLGGTLRHSRSLDTLLAIDDVSTLLLVLPVELRPENGLHEGHRVNFTALHVNHAGQGRIVRVDNAVQYMNGRPVRLCMVRIDKGAAALLPGMHVRCTIGREPMTVAGQIWTFVRRQWW